MSSSKGKEKEAELLDLLAATPSQEERARIQQQPQESKKEIRDAFGSKAIQSVDEFIETQSFNIGVKVVEETKANQKRNEKLEEYKKRLKGFTRTIPSFLMAYGYYHNDKEKILTLEELEHFIPDEVFQKNWARILGYSIAERNCPEAKREEISFPIKEKRL